MMQTPLCLGIGELMVELAPSDSKAVKRGTLPNKTQVFTGIDKLTSTQQGGLGGRSPPGCRGVGGRSPQYAGEDGGRQTPHI